MSINSQLRGLNIKKIKMTNGKTLERNLRDEAIRLRDCIQKRLDEYLDENPPKMYERELTGNLRKSLQVEDFMDIRVTPTSLEIYVFFDDNANHMSGDGIEGWSGTGEEVNTAYLLDHGYEVRRNVWFKDIENFGWREGGNFVQKGIDDFNRTNKLGIVVKKIYPNGYLV